MDLSLKIAIIGALAVIIGAFIKLLGDLASKDDPQSGLIFSIIILIIGIIGAGIFVLWIPTPESEGETPITPTKETSTAFSLAGNWAGTIRSDDGNFSTDLNLSFATHCRINEVCGTYDAYQLPCAGTLTLISTEENSFVFLETRTEGEEWCSSWYEHITKVSNNSILYGGSKTTSSEDIQSTGLLSKR